MKSRHIIKILDRTEFRRIAAADLFEIGEHIKECLRCRTAFRTAQIASILLKEKSLAELPAPPPFFQSKVLSAWREKQNAVMPFAAFRRWWQASATLVWLMFVTVIGLMALSLAAPHSETAVNFQKPSEINLYSAETVILNQKPPRNLTTGQVFEALDDK